MSRRRYIYDETTRSMVEVQSDWVGQAMHGGLASEAEIYGNLQTVEGHDISSRKKRREYMKAHGLTDPSDFKNHYVEKAKERDKLMRGQIDTTNGERKKQLARLWDEAHRGRR